MLLSGNDLLIGTLAYRKVRDDTFEGPPFGKPPIRALVSLTVEATDDAAAEVPAVKPVAELLLERLVKTDRCRLGGLEVIDTMSFSGTVNSLSSRRPHSALTFVSREF
jgi:hypothetical protein